MVSYVANIEARLEAMLAPRDPARFEMLEKAIRQVESTMPVGDPSTYEPDFRAPSAKARGLALGVALQLARTAFRTGEELPLPKFRAAGDGSVYLHWKTQHGELLVSAPFEGGDSARFFGDTINGVTMEGAVRLGDPSGFLARWLLENV